jgi:hypothetical protein
MEHLFRRIWLEMEADFIKRTLNTHVVSPELYSRKLEVVNKTRTICSELSVKNYDPFIESDETLTSLKVVQR